MPCTVVFVTATLLALATPARAQRGGDPATRKARAIRLHKEGGTEFGLGHFEKALELFEKSYEAWPYLYSRYNAGLALTALGQYEAALSRFREYQRGFPEARDCLEKIAELERVLEKEKPPPAPPPGPAPGEDKPTKAAGSGASPPSEPVGRGLAPRRASAPLPAAPGVGPTSSPVPWWHDTWGWGVAGSGAVLAGTSLWLWSSSASLTTQAEREPDEVRQRQLFASASTRRAFAGLTGALGVAGLVVGIVKLATPENPRAKAALSGLTFGPAGVVYTRRF